MNGAEPTFDPVGLLGALTGIVVDFVLIGGMAGVAHGSGEATEDIGVCCSRARDNLDRLAAVLRDLGAALRGAPPGLPFLLDGATLAAGANFTFATEYRDLRDLSR